MLAILTLVTAALLGAHPKPVEPEAPSPPPPQLAAGAPVLAWGKPIHCFSRGQGPMWRAQCDDKTRTCLVAVDGELDSEGKVAGGLERTSYCSPGASAQDLLRKGYRFIDAVAEAPPGWRRDERGRVMQTSFDLDRRVWVGGGFVPYSKGPGNLQGLVSVGFRDDIYVDDEDWPTMYRLSLFNGESLTDASRLEATTFHLDTSRGGKRPGLRVTTFLGTPSRHDVDLSLGLWLDALTIELHDAGARRHARLGFGAIGGTLDLWHSQDLESYVRLRGDVGFEQDRTRREIYCVPTGAAEADLVLGDKGLHHLKGLAQYERLVPMQAGGVGSDRLRFRLAYEVGLVAINDQPLTAVFEARADRRGDLPDLPEQWEVQALGSLRFSLWVPARRNASTQTVL